MTEEPSVFYRFATNFNDEDNESNQRKRRKTIHYHHPNPAATSPIQWRSHNEQRIYSSKLVRALHYVLRRKSTKPDATRSVREAADRVLAATAKGRTRWSRAVLLNPLRMACGGHKKVKRATGNGRLTKKRTALWEELKRRGRDDMSRQIGSPAVHLENRVRVLGRLVPGCRKAPLRNLLEEATDYIGALEMQIRAMTAIAELLASGRSTDRVDPSQA